MLDTAVCRVGSPTVKNLAAAGATMAHQRKSGERGGERDLDRAFALADDPYPPFCIVRWIAGGIRTARASVCVLARYEHGLDSDRRNDRRRSVPRSERGRRRSGT